MAVIRVAAVGDIHLGEDCSGKTRPLYEGVVDDADVLLLAGDLTRLGTRAEAAVVARELGGLGLTTLAVLGNHDHQSGEQEAICDLLGEAGIEVLEGSGTIVDVAGRRLGVAGAKGFGGGFAGACATEFGEEIMKAFVRHTKQTAEALADAIDKLEADCTVALLHYSPTDTTLAGEPVAIHPFLGSYLLGEAVDGEPRGARPVDLVVHGHAHRGTERGHSAAGVRVRNVAQPVIRSAYRVYCLGADELECSPATAGAPTGATTTTP